MRSCYAYCYVFRPHECPPDSTNHNSHAVHLLCNIQDQGSPKQRSNHDPGPYLESSKSKSGFVSIVTALKYAGATGSPRIQLDSNDVEKPNSWIDMRGWPFLYHSEQAWTALPGPNCTPTCPEADAHGHCIVKITPQIWLCQYNQPSTNVFSQAYTCSEQLVELSEESGLTELWATISNDIDLAAYEDSMMLYRLISYSHSILWTSEVLITNLLPSWHLVLVECRLEKCLTWGHIECFTSPTRIATLKVLGQLTYHRPIPLYILQYPWVLSRTVSPDKHKACYCNHSSLTITTSVLCSPEMTRRSDTGRWTPYLPERFRPESSIRTFSLNQ